MAEEFKKPTKEDALKSLKKEYNKHRISYKDFMLKSKMIEKYWKNPEEETHDEGVKATVIEKIQRAEDVELPVNPEL